mmetsp:Transcript_239/g.646  ORF Transcript_239/g.646 Transcript_239/m.646 type:complete len:351 (-) Transcript_239:235-1287(-)
MQPIARLRAIRPRTIFCSRTAAPNLVRSSSKETSLSMGTSARASSSAVGSTAASGPSAGSVHGPSSAPARATHSCCAASRSVRRSVGPLRSSPRMSPRVLSGTPAPIVGCACTIRSSKSGTERATNGGAPSSIQCKHTPAAHMSARCSESGPLSPSASRSGQQKAGVPPDSGRPCIQPAPSHSRASPKSPTSSCRRWPSRKFSGFRSPCVTPRACMCASALRSARKCVRASASGSGCARTLPSIICPPGASCITRKTESELGSSRTSCRLMMCTCESFLSTAISRRTGAATSSSAAPVVVEAAGANGPSESLGLARGRRICLSAYERPRCRSSTRLTSPKLPCPSERTTE